MQKLESFYKNRTKLDRFSWTDAIKASWHYVVFILTSVEYFFAVIGVYFVAAAFRMVPAPATDIVLNVGVYWLLIILFTALTSLLVSILFLTFCFRINWNVWSLTVPAVVLAALVLSQFSSSIWAVLSNTPELDNPSFFWQFFGFYAVVQTYLLLVHEDKLCFQDFKRRMIEGDIELEIPVPMRGKLLSITAQDQAVKITTNYGSHHLRQGFAKAVARIRNIDGILVHRSHWVAKDAIAKMETFGGRSIVILRNGQKIPVSGKNISAVKDIVEKN